MSKKICGVKAVGTQILVEMLSAGESLETQLHVPDNSKAPPMGYIIDIGPAMKPDEWGIKLGDRVLLQGNFVPVPWRTSSNRMVAAVDPYTVKCVLHETEDD